MLKVEGLRLHLLFGAGIALLFGAAGYLAQGRVAHPYSAILWAAASVLTPVLTLVALNYGVTGFAPLDPVRRACACCSPRCSRSRPNG